ncbi:MAG: hypothetical protein K6F21_04225 [Bacteroidales bacterium]|nr:hypothetical protein [Bacteroidales bacterium]
MEEKKLYPFRLTRIEDKYSWGSEQFRLADLGYRDTFVLDGWLSGNTMGDMMETYLDRVTGDHIFDAYGVQFPFQIRKIQVAGKMPLRVSPDDEMARDRYDHLGKEKLWYVLQAGKGSRLLIGFRRDTDASELYSECLEGNPENLMNTLEPRAGQFFFIPSGTPHCAFGEMSIVEVSESSAMDFCLCNWGSPEGLSEEFDPSLNIIDALDFIKYERYPEKLLAGRNLNDGETSAEDAALGFETLLKIKQFTVNKINLKQPIGIDTDRFGSCIAYTSLKGSFEIQTTPEVSPDSERLLAVTEGETALIPAECSNFIIAPRTADTVLLEVMVEKLPADDETFYPSGDGGEDLVGDGAEDLG